jgi:hypothetical protein
LVKLGRFLFGTLLKLKQERQERVLAELVSGLHESPFRLFFGFRLLRFPEIDFHIFNVIFQSKSDKASKIASVSFS